jgi:hypothetical protein
MKRKPILMEHPLSKRVYIVTRYRFNGDGSFTAYTKYDITEQFDRLAKLRARTVEK